MKAALRERSSHSEEEEDSTEVRMLGLMPTPQLSSKQRPAKFQTETSQPGLGTSAYILGHSLWLMVDLMSILHILYVHSWLTTKDSFIYTCIYRCSNPLSLALI